MSLLGLEHLGDNWLADAHGVLWNRAYQTSTPVREHQWHTNGCPSCSGCVYPRVHGSRDVRLHEEAGGMTTADSLRFRVFADSVESCAVEGVDELLGLFVEGWVSPGAAKNIVAAVLSWVEPELAKVYAENDRLGQQLQNLIEAIGDPKGDGAR